MSKQYVCEKCNYAFTRKQDLERHNNTRKDCNSGSKTNKKPINFGCKHCKKIFSRKDNMVRHMGTCKKKKIKNVVSDSKDLVINNGDSNLSFLKSPVTINLIVFGKDGIDNINAKDIKKMLKTNNNLIQEMVTQINFNPDKPQHHNVYYPDLKSGYGVVYENKQWVTKKIDEIINTLLDAKIEDLNEILSEMGDFLNKETIDKIRKALEDANHKSPLPGSRKRLMNYIKPILYNNKNMIIKTRKLTRKEEEELLDAD